MRLRGATVALAVLPPAVVLAVDPAGWFPFGPAKWLAVATLVPLAAAAVVAERPVRLHRGATAAALALTVWLAIAAAVGEDPLYAWTGTPERHFGVATWVLCGVALVAGQCVASDRDLQRALASGGVAAGLGLGLVAAAEALGWEPAALDAGSRLTATFGSSAYLGAATALLGPVCAGVALEPRLHRGARAVAAVAVVTLAVACVGSGARASWFGLAVAAATVGLLRRRQLAARRGAVLAATVTLVAVGVALATLGPVGPRLGSTFDAGEPGGRGRLDEWAVATAVIADHPLTGTGPEGYRVAFGGAVDPGYERAHGRDPLPDRAHAAPLDVAAAGGIPALLAWGAVAVIALRAAARAVRDGRPAMAGAGAGLVAHAGNQLLLFPTMELEPLAWLLAGVLVAPGLVDGRGRGRDRLAGRGVPALLAVLGLAGAVAGTTELVADRRAARAVDALAAGQTARGVDEAAAAADLRPDVVRFHLLEAQALVAAERGTRQAIEAVDAALDVSPGDPIARLDRVELLVVLASATRLPGDVAAARHAATRFVAADPNRAAGWLQAGAAHQLAGDERGAIDAWTRAETLAPRSAAAPVDLALLHLEAGRPAEALAAARRAVKADPGDDRARRVLALVEARA